MTTEREMDKQRYRQEGQSAEAQPADEQYRLLPGEDIFDAAIRWSKTHTTPPSPEVDPALNPKHAAGAARPGTHYVPPTPLLEVGEVMKRGAAKYGAYNWGEGGVVASIYYDAIERHRAKWWAGEELSEDDRCHHLAHIAACALILLDCAIMGKLHDDRPAKTSSPVEYQLWKDGLL